MKTSKQTLKNIALGGIFLLTVFINVLSDFVRVDFDAAIFSEPAYWLNLATINIAVLIIILTARSYSRDNELKTNCDYLDTQAAIDNAYIEFNKRKLNTEFTDYIDKINKTNNCNITLATIFSRTNIKMTDNYDMREREGKAIFNLMISRVLSIISFSLIFTSIIVSNNEFNLAMLYGTFFKLFQVATALYIGLSAGTDYVAGEVLIKTKLKLNFIQKFLEQRITNNE